jgi:hypothetical protein
MDNNMNTGGNNMGTVDTGTAGVLALLADTARAGRGYGGWGGEGGYGGYGMFASPGANAVRMNRNNDRIGFTYDALSQQAEEGRRIAQNQNLTNAVTDGFSRICERINNESSSIRDIVFQQELRNGDRLRDLQKEMNDNARVAAQCCCDLKLQACEDKAQIIAEIKAVETRTVERDLNRAERRLETQTILTQCGCGCQGGVRPCPPPFPPQG